MIRKKQTNKGFTLIELMVVIVIIGVLASLAIPRFTEASDKAKVAEAPRILSSYESAYLAALAEKGSVTDAVNDVAFDAAAVSAASKWFNYVVVANGTAATAEPRTKIGKFNQTKLITTYTADADQFTQTSDAYATAVKYVPNFFRVTQ